MFATATTKQNCLITFRGVEVIEGYENEVVICCHDNVQKKIVPIVLDLNKLL